MFDDALIRRAHNFLAHGRLYAINRAPYAASMLMKLVPYFIEIETMAVSRSLVLYVNPVWLTTDPELSQNGRPKHKVIGACLMHEWSHPTRGMERLDQLDDPDLANISGDLAINADLRKAGWELPSWVQYPEKYGFPEGKTLEWYYRELKKLPRSSIQVSVGPGGGRCGGCAGTPFPFERSIDVTLGRSPVEVEQVRQETYKQLEEYIKQRGAGSVPGFFSQSIQFKRESPIVPWERVLAHTGRRAMNLVAELSDDYSYAKILKRSIPLGVLRPGLVGYTPRVAVIRDTSMSMGEEEMNTANNQIIDVMKTLGIDEILLLDADTQIHGEPRLVRITQIPKIEVFGRGGTDFVQPLKYIEKMRDRPEVVFYTTDSDGRYPAHPPPGIDVIWCIIPNGRIRRPPWGKVVICSNDPAVRRAASTT